MNCGVLVSLQRQKRVFPREKEKSCQTERRILDGSKSEREKAKKKNSNKKKQTAAQKCKNGRVGYFVLFLSICGLKWLLFFEHQHNLYPSNTPHEKKRKKTRRKKW